MTSGNMHFSLVSHALRLGSFEDATLPVVYNSLAASPTASAIDPGPPLLISSSASALHMEVLLSVENDAFKDVGVQDCQSQRQMKGGEVYRAT